MRLRPVPQPAGAPGVHRALYDDGQLVVDLWEGEQVMAVPRRVKACGAQRIRAAQCAENVWTVLVRYVWPGRSTVEGQDGWFGESGKCWVSRHMPSPCR